MDQPSSEPVDTVLSVSFEDHPREIKFCLAAHSKIRSNGCQWRDPSVGQYDARYGPGRPKATTMCFDSARRMLGSRYVLRAAQNLPAHPLRRVANATLKV
ncbi:hypothetical protein MUK42_07808 [Musa troglodytarum]|uniref:Uncharacterized protein n=1 Tax=Musa troglodytarum TaxID=320322 RepID=A0A9E7EBJ3_9LILI|nr:hypothetical protein MUK42_07808 [Musa troglodytarum]